MNRASLGVGPPFLQLTLLDFYSEKSSFCSDFIFCFSFSALFPLSLSLYLYLSPAVPSQGAAVWVLLLPLLDHLSNIQSVSLQTDSPGNNTPNLQRVYIKVLHSKPESTEV